jgi:S1-C subfamily serine protease
MASLDALVRDNVALLVVLGHYEGRIGSGGGQRVSLDVPLAHGTAFVVGRGGAMLTNRHVVEAGNDKRIPASLDDAGMPTVTLRSTSYLVCFGPDRAQQFEAKLVHESDRFDLAVLSAAPAQFAEPLRLADRAPRLGEEVFVAGYPGALQEAFDKEFRTRARFADAVQRLRATGQVNLIDELFSPEAFQATVTRGVISTAERHLGGVAHTQFDARVSPGNSGGPVLDADRRVIAIVTKGGAGAAQGYNFGLLVDQLRDELAPYVGRENK